MYRVTAGICIALQLWFLVTCGIAVGVWSGTGFPRHPDEVIFNWLIWAKLVAGPASVAMLLFKPDWGRWFTIALFAVYIAGVIAMPVIAGHTFIMAYFENTFWMGQGPVFAFVYAVLVALLILVPRQRVSETPPQPG